MHLTPTLLRYILKRIATMDHNLQALTDEVAATQAVEASAIALIDGFQARLDAALASADPRALSDLSAQLAAERVSLAAAVAANTPAATAPTPPTNGSDAASVSGSAAGTASNDPGAGSPTA